MQNSSAMTEDLDEEMNENSANMERMVKYGHAA